MRPGISSEPGTAGEPVLDALMFAVALAVAKAVPEPKVPFVHHCPDHGHPENA